MSPCFFAVIAVLIAGVFLFAEEAPKDDLILTPIEVLSRTGIILGRPTDRSITMNVLPPDDGELVVDYGTAAGSYSKHTSPVRMTRDTPIVISLEDLTPDTKWFYRISVRSGNGGYLSGREYSFHTQRARASAFSFIVEADPHLDGNSSVPLYTNAIVRMASENADLFFDIGDTFMSEKLNPQNEASVTMRHIIFRPFLETVAASSPFMFVLGNHEAEFGWTDKKLAKDLPAWAYAARSRFYPNPGADAFFMTDGVGKEFENYYAFEWGDALFVVLDPFRYTTRKSGGRSGDNWSSTLGEKQYRWFVSVLEKSSARFKFVFVHQLVGGSPEGGRGGVEFARFYEWGGQNKDGSDGFAQKRPGWGRPIHQVMKDTGVSAFFHGHDHLYVKQELDGIIYQACPQPSAKNTMDPSYAADYGYTSGTIIGNSGYLRVSVTAANAVVDYVRITIPRGRTVKYEWNIADTYTIAPRR